jgi:tryptophan-rich sensory protein
MSKRTEQKLMGLGMLIICAFVLLLCSMGTTPKDQDATAVVMLAPLALWLIFSKEIVIY